MVLGGWERCNAGCSNLPSFSLQKAVDSGLFLSCDALMDILFPGSVKNTARLIHLELTGLPPTKMSQTPEMHLGGQQLWPFLGSAVDTTSSIQTPAGETLRSLLCPHLGTAVSSRAALPVAGTALKTNPAVASAHHHSCECQAQVRLPRGCCHPPQACRAWALGQKLHFFYQNALFAAESVLLWCLQKVVKEMNSRKS